MFNATGPSTGDAAQPPAATMLQMIAGFWIARAVWAAAELGLADLLPAPRSVDDLARDTGTQPDALYRLMRALASVGVFRELDDRRFESTPLADTLRSDSPDSVRALARSELGHGHYAAWGEILYSLRTGKPSFDHVFGMPIFEWFGKHPERSAVFNQSMSELTRTVEPAVLEAYDFSACGTIVDVGGCFGSLLIAILTKYPALRGVVFDAPDVAAAAQAKIHAAGLSDRLAAVGGDFFQAVPGGGDTYLMKHIIHDWTDAQCVTLLRHCRDVMKAGGKLLILDQVLPGPNEASLGKFSDLIMLQLPGGRERTAGEFERLLNDSGFDLARIVPTRSPVSIIEGVRR